MSQCKDTGSAVFPSGLTLEVPVSYKSILDYRANNILENLGAHWIHVALPWMEVSLIAYWAKNKGKCYEIW